MLRFLITFLITWVVLFFVVAFVTSIIGGLGAVEILVVALVTAALAVLIARRRGATRTPGPG